MGKTAEAQFGYCQVCRVGDHEACRTNGCRCRQTEEHNDGMKSTKEDDQDLPEGFTWEEPPPQAGRHPLSPEIQLLLKTRPGKFAHIRHYKAKSSAYNIVRNFAKGKYDELDRTQWELREVKDGVYGPGSDLYAAYIGE